MIVTVESGSSEGVPVEPALPGTRASFTNEAIEVIATRLDLRSEAVRASATLLSEAEQQRASRFAFDLDRRRFTAARSQLRRLLGVRLDVQPDSVELVYGERGKPALAPRFAASGLRFNVAHCNDVAVYAFSRGREIGIDVEAVRVIRDADDIAASFFSRRENEAYSALDLSDKPLGFFNCWTRKEAFIKALGDGLYHPLNRFDVSLAPGEPARILRVENVPGNLCGWTLHGFLPGLGLTGAVVVRKLAHELTSKVVPERVLVRSLPLH
jgi:4'-phosphopantetheinyl transferase